MKIKMIIAVLLIALFTGFGLMPEGVSAEEITRDFTDLAENEEFLVCIEGENTRPIVKFVSPTEEIFDTAEERPDTKISVGKQMLYYYIENAEKGHWQIIYDKLDNSEIMVTLEQPTSPLVVKYVNVLESEIYGNRVPVDFYAEYKDSRSINYTIYVSSNEESRGKEIDHGSCWTNENVRVNADLGSVSSYSDYRIYVYVWFNDDGVDIFEGMYSQPFSYTNPEQKDFTTPVKAVIKPNEFSADLNWEPQYGYTYIVSIFEDGNTEPDYYDEITDTNVTSHSFSYSPDAGKIELRIAEKYGNGNYSTEKVFKCDLSSLPGVEFDKAQATNKRYVSLHYKGFTEKNRVEIEVNEERRETILYTQQEGDLEVEINQEINNVKVLYYLADDFVVEFAKEIYFNNTAPHIYMMNDYSNVKTDKDTIELSGTVQGADKVLVDGNEIALESDGSFTYKAELKSGENVITIEAYDVLGNGSVYTARIVYSPSSEDAGTEDDGKDTEKVSEDEGKDSDGSDDSSDKGDKDKDKAKDDDEDKEDTGAWATIKKYLPLIIAIVIGLAIVIFVLVKPKGSKKGVLVTIRNAGIFIFALSVIADGYLLYNWLKIKNSNSQPEFINKAYESVDDAKALLVEEADKKDAFITGAVVVGICAGIMVLLIAITAIAGVVRKKKAAKKANPNQGGGSPVGNNYNPNAPMNGVMQQNGAMQPNGAPVANNYAQAPQMPGGNQMNGAVQQSGAPVVNNYAQVPQMPDGNQMNGAVQQNGVPTDNNIQ